ncbi:UNVERIFIED_CONTAM: hypothetical protein K2H54_065167 [Gekko kuhli]
MDEVESFNFFRSGDHLIAGLVSAVVGVVAVQKFRETPFLRQQRAENFQNTQHVSHGFHLAVLKDRTRFPFFYRTAPKEEAQYLGIVKLLMHFRWTWVGLLAQDNDDGNRFKSTLTAVMLKRGICVAFSESMAETGVQASAWSETKKYQLLKRLSQDQVKVFVLYGDVPAMLILEILIGMIERVLKAEMGKIWITTLVLDTLWSLHCSPDPVYFPRHGSLSVVTQAKKREMYHHTQVCNPLMKEFMEQAFDSSRSKPVLSVRGQLRYREKERLEARPWEALKEYLPVRAYNIYTGVHAVAHALHAAYSSRSERMMRARGAGLENGLLQPWQLHPFLRHFQSYNTSVGRANLDENRGLATDLDIVNMMNHEDCDPKLA